MSASIRARLAAQPWTKLRVVGKRDAEEGAVFWRINGYPARLVIWTPDEWDRLDTPPPDAQFHPAGVWCALRLD
jgi:hypothetical protein